MKICIAGLTASGKSTLGELLSKELGIAFINPTYKDFVKSDTALIKLVGKQTVKFAKLFDANVAKMVRENRDCVISTWYAPWLIKGTTLNVWLDVNKEERARRWAKDHKESLSKARRMVYAKDSETMAHFKKTYKKDMDMSVFDIRINCDKITLKEAVSLVSMLALVKEKKLFR